MTEIIGAKWLEQPEDTLAWATEENLLQQIVKLPALDQKYIQLNQNRKQEHVYACTYYASIWAICDLYNYDEATYIKLVDATVEEALKQGKYNPKSWAYTSESAKIACDVHNKLMPNKVHQFRTEIGKSTFYSLLSRNYSMVCTYKISSGYQSDIKDWILEWTNFKNESGGHCIRWSNAVRDTSKKPKKPYELTVLDNYYNINNTPSSGWKQYKIATTNIGFLHPDPYYNYSYFFVDSTLI